MIRRCLTVAATAALVTPALAGVGVAAPACRISYGMHDAAKPNKLFLYFPTAEDATFPEFGLVTPTSPAAPFDAADLTSYTGTTTGLRDAVTDVVAADYCEFNVRVEQTTTAPSPLAGARRNVVAIGSDSGDFFGQAEMVDIGDSVVLDNARVWAGTYQDTEGGLAGALSGPQSTLQRWAHSIGGTAAHEAGHSYGLSHGDGASVAPGEDPLTRHIMPAGSLLTGEDRAGYRRHFNNREFSLLASNVGLSVQTMHNWDLVNPNAQAAERLTMDFLTPDPTVIMSWAYTGDRSPWSTPAVVGPLGVETFKGQAYHRFRLEWSSGQPWSGGTPGRVPGGGTFHVGATFSGIDFDQPDPVIIKRIELQDAAGDPLALQPRLPGYDAGTFDSADGSLDLRFFNDDDRPLVLRNMITRELPRLLSLDAMMPGAEELTDVGGEVFSPWRGSTRVPLRLSEPIERGQELPVTVATLGQGRHILETATQHDCATADNQHGGPDTLRCGTGMNVDLFPATTLYVTATVVDPAAEHWDPAKERYVVGPLATKLFLQIAGRHPDLNRNEVDDAVDIASETSRDDNQDGVPDEAQDR